MIIRHHQSLHHKKKMPQGTSVSIRSHKIALFACCVGNKMFCTLVPHVNVGGIWVMFQSGKATYLGFDFFINFYSNTTT